MLITNPYVEQKHQLMRENPVPDEAVNKKIMELEIKAREYLDSKIASFDTKLEKLREESVSVAKDYPSKRQQYKKLIQLYREAFKLTKEISQTKKEMREE